LYFYNLTRLVHYRFVETSEASMEVKQTLLYKTNIWSRNCSRKFLYFIINTYIYTSGRSRGAMGSMPPSIEKVNNLLYRTYEKNSGCSSKWIISQTFRHLIYYRMGKRNSIASCEKRLMSQKDQHFVHFGPAYTFWTFPESFSKFSNFVWKFFWMPPITFLGSTTDIHLCVNTKLYITPVSKNNDLKWKRFTSFSNVVLSVIHCNYISFMRIRLNIIYIYIYNIYIYIYIYIWIN